CTPNLNYSGIIPILNESVSYVRFYSNDTLGNEESVKNITVKIDRTQPLITHIELQPELSYYGPSVSNLVLLVNFTDETSGVNFCNYTIYYPNATPYLENQDTDNDNGISGQANGTFPMPNLTGIYAINITCYDAAGLFVQNSTTFNLDLENPIAELALLPTYVNGIVEINGTANDNQNLFNYTINIINSTSGVVLTYTNDTAKNNELLHSFNSSAFENGLYTIQLIVYDSAGNYNETNITTTIDNEPPTTTCTADDLWHNSDMTIYLIAIDALSGVNVTYYCTGENCTPTNVYDNLTGIDITSEGTTAIKYYSIDNLNNAETTKNCSVKIDKTKPTTSDNVPDGWQNAPYNVTIIPQDGLSGVNYTTYCLDGNCNNVSGTLEFNIEINTSGNHTIQYFSVDNAGNIQDNVTKYAALDLNAPKINSAWLGEPDIFYSPYPENSIITIYANITDEHSGIKNVLANFSGLSCGEKNMTYNSSSGLYETSCDASYDAETKNFENVILKIIAYDNVENEQETQLLTILYNMTTFEFENPNCFRHGSLSTNFSQQLDFNSVNFIADIEMNLSCFGFDVGWMKVATLNFSTLNFSDPSIGSKLANLANAINVTPKLPRELGDARIDINTTAFAELNTNTTITLYNLPFASQPNITADNSSKQGSIRVISWEPFLMPFLYNGSLIGILGGNLTFAVEGFSGYNITENIAPTINITIPENGSLTRSPFVNITANGTGTEISKVVLTVNGTTYYYNSSVQDIECVPISEGSDIFYCAINLTSLPDGNHTINITAYDYGGTSGNSVTGSAVFELDKTAPVIIFSLSTATVYVGQTITATCTATDARDGTITPTYTVNPSTSTAGTFTTTCTATDAAGNTAISSLTYTVNNWPSGGGSSGGTGVIVPTASMIWAVLEENSEKTFNVANKDIDVTEFSLSIKKASSNVMIKIKKLGSKPSIVPELKNAYSYLEIEKTNLQEDNINRIKIKFKVSKKWLNEKGIAKQDITLNHYKNNKWNELPTTIKSEDSEFVYYEAETSSLSYFAIAQTSKPTMPTTTPTPTVTPTQIPTQTPTPTETPEQTPMKTQTPVKEGEKLSDKTSLLILVVLIVVLLLLTYLIYRKKAFV
ncbi:MAG: PGF-pre-PGF domain-containing protein, partial [Candidatus Woesearchaeota archaeon]